jgi:ABC-type polar amino acid transport system ATPase subunit
LKSFATCVSFFAGRFYPIESGQIFIDDVDVSTLSAEFVRYRIAIASQSPVLFSMSVLDNIRLGSPDASPHDASSAAQLGNAHDFIMEFGETYNTLVQHMSLSGGQKQWICISRAILADTPVLLLDEATAALDTESEQRVQESLDSLRHGKTIIVIAHRLATVMTSCLREVAFTLTSSDSNFSKEIPSAYFLFLSLTSSILPHNFNARSAQSSSKDTGAANFRGMTGGRGRIGIASRGEGYQVGGKP